MKPFSLLFLAVGALSAPWSLYDGAAQQLFSPAADERLAPFKTAPPAVTAGLEGEEVVLRHSAVPGYQVRLKNPAELGCDHGRPSQSGYLDALSGRKYFFWWFPARATHKNKDFIVWTNGGPGCSSFCGSLQELGPCRIGPNGTSTTYNPYSWTEEASVLFIDQPVGVGFSYTDRSNDTGDWSTPEAADSMLAFLTILFSAFQSSLAHANLHLAGESFAGRYLPFFADRVVKFNAKTPASERLPLKTVMIGNGNTDPLVQYESYWTVACTNATGHPPVLDQDSCTKMLEDLPQCIRLIRKCHSSGIAAVCSEANEFCEASQTDEYYKTGRSPYDLDHWGAYEEDALIEKYLNTAPVRKALGVDPAVKRYRSCSDKVGERFSATGDQARASYKQIANVLESGIYVLIYCGARDFICNCISNERWTLQLDWSGKEAFVAQALRPWSVAGNDSPAGYFRSAHNLTFATVEYSGHFVPYDQPVASLALTSAWLGHGHLGPLSALST